MALLQSAMRDAPAAVQEVEGVQAPAGGSEMVVMRRPFIECDENGLGHLPDIYCQDFRLGSKTCAQAACSRS
jgi:hypothetical protein